MKCPVCNTVDLLMSERNGIEIDYCPQCRGVWLDRGELDKIIERSASMGQAPAAQPAYPAQQQPAYHAAPPPQYPQQNRHQGDYDRHQPQHYDKHYGHHKKRREGFLSDLFDFD